MLDLVIRNGRIVDGTGAPGFFGDIAIEGGRIAGIASRIPDKARNEIDAAGQVVAPGFIDPHTHYDAQLLWDPLCTSSSWHGTTTVIAGNCGFTLAPCRAQDRDYLTRMLAVVEEMPLEALREGIKWNWEDFPDYLVALEKLPKAVNFGCYVGHSAVRRYVMGENCRRAATESEIAAMQEVVARALRAGAIGISSSRSANHVDGEGQSVPSFYAEMPELLAFSRALRQVGRGIFEFTSKMSFPKGEHEAGDLLEMVALAKEAGRPVTWVSVRHMPAFPERSSFILAEVAKAMAREGVRLYPQIGCRTLVDIMNWRRLMRVFADLPTWREVMFLAAGERIIALGRPETRARLRVEAASAKFFNGWQYVLAGEAKLPENRKWRGKSIAAIAAEQGKDPLDAFLDLSVAEDCEMDFLYAVADMEDAPLAHMLKDPNTLLTTDAGAHLASICNADFPSHILAHWVRETGILGLEEAVNLLTGRPARALGLADRGYLRAGLNADLVVFDPDNIREGEQQIVYDLPTSKPRIIRPAHGIRTVIVNGQIVLKDNQHTGNLPGQLVRGI